MSSGICSNHGQKAPRLWTMYGKCRGPGFQHFKMQLKAIVDLGLLSHTELVFGFVPDHGSFKTKGLTSFSELGYVLLRCHVQDAALHERIGNASYFEFLFPFLLDRTLFLSKSTSTIVFVFHFLVILLALMGFRTCGAAEGNCAPEVIDALESVANCVCLLEINLRHNSSGPWQIASFH